MPWAICTIALGAVAPSSADQRYTNTCSPSALASVEVVSCMPLPPVVMARATVDVRSSLGGSVAGMFDVATAAIEGALAAGATYADARVVATTAESMEVRNQVVEGLRQDESLGVGVRALMGSSWGFFAVADPSKTAARRAGEQAAATARASAMVAGPPLRLADVPTVEAEWSSTW